MLVSQVEDIDVDHSGDIDVHEFSAWMEHKVSSATMALVVAKIVLGLGQVVSKQPEVVKEDFPGPQWDSNLLKVFSLDFGWIAPICQVSYVRPARALLVAQTIG